METILVTGGAGFIGSHTCVELLLSGFRVIIVDSFSNSSRLVINKIKKIVEQNNSIFAQNLKVIKGDLRNYRFLMEIFENEMRGDNSIKGVIHFAGLKSVSESMVKPLLYWQVNLQSSLNLLDVMNSFDCKTLVFSSSASIYGISNEKTIKEDYKIQPINTYGKTKATIENILNDVYNSSQNWKIINLRYFNPIGAHPTGIIGENPKNIPNNLFPLMMKVGMGQIKELKIYGSDWPTIDGTCERDYIHVVDLAIGHVKALNLLFNEKPQILNLNLGNGIGISVLQLIKTFEKVNNIKIPYFITDKRSGDVAKYIADNCLAKRLLNWLPQKNINDMCIDGWRWQLKNPNGFQD